MGQVGVRCVKGYIPTHECRQCMLDPAHPCMLRPEMLEFFREENSSEPGLEEFSPTRLLGCKREAVLRGGVDYYTSIEGAWPRLRGTMVHAAFEKTPDWPGVLTTIRELRPRLITQIDTKYGPKRFSGKPDMVVIRYLDDERFVAEVVDYKSIGKIEHELTEAKWEHIWQVNMYRYLVEKELAGYLRWNYPISVETLEIVYVDMQTPRRFTSAATLTARGKRTSWRPLTHETLELEPIPIFSTETVEGFIRQLIEERIEAETKLPPPYSKNDTVDKTFMCINCPVREVCFKIADEIGEEHA